MAAKKNEVSSIGRLEKRDEGCSAGWWLLARISLPGSIGVLSVGAAFEFKKNDSSSGSKGPNRPFSWMVVVDNGRSSTNRPSQRLKDAPE